MTAYAAGMDKTREAPPGLLYRLDFRHPLRRLNRLIAVPASWWMWLIFFAIPRLTLLTWATGELGLSRTLAVAWSVGVFCLLAFWALMVRKLPLAKGKISAPHAAVVIPSLVVGGIMLWVGRYDWATLFLLLIVQLGGLTASTWRDHVMSLLGRGQLVWSAFVGSPNFIGFAIVMELAIMLQARKSYAQRIASKPTRDDWVLQSAAHCEAGGG